MPQNIAHRVALVATGLLLTHAGLAMAAQPRFAASQKMDQPPTRGAAPLCDGSSTVISESTDYNTISATGSLNCSTNDGTYGHSYGRYHDLAVDGTGSDLELVCVHWGIQSSTYALDVQVNVYLDTDGIESPGSSADDLTLLASSSGQLSTGNTFYYTANFNSETLPADALVFVELVVADGTNLGDHFVGTNGLGQSSASWIKTTDGFCGLGNWSTMSNIGFPDVHFVEYMEVRGATPADPCDDPLPATCSGDIWGPLDGPDGEVNVSDLLKVIADWNQLGDGSARPAGDCAPLPNGDCTVDVSDLLKVIADWGSECAPAPTGACCVAPGECYDDVALDDCPVGNWSENTACGDAGCEVVELDLYLNELRTSHPGPDDDEYVELAGAPGTSLDNVWYVLIEDSNSSGDYGVVDEAVLLTGYTLPSDGIFLIGEETMTLATPDLVVELNHENGDQATYLLVRDFTGFEGDDLDTDDDGQLDLVPWSSIIDSVAFLGPDPASGNAVYSGTTVGPDGNFVPGHAIRCGAGSWNVGCFDLLADTPGAPNNCESGDSDGDGEIDTCDNCPDLANEDQADCDGDGIGDACAIADGLATDCNGNGIPDNCDTDCDGNGIPDDCDLADGASDCDGNGIIDACEDDCNANGIADPCDITDGTSFDDNGNGVPDECETPVFVINEINADPSSDPDGTYGDGDANGDGVGNFGQDEFVEFVNYSGDPIDLTGWTVSDGFGVRHEFPIGTVLDDQCAFVLFGGGTPTGSFGNSIVQTASTGSLGLNNGGDTITLTDSTGTTVLSVTYGSEAGNNQSITLVPDVFGSTFVPHSEIAPDGSLFSPGTRVDGTPLGSCEVPLDTDGDGVPDSVDNCIDLPNANQADCDEDGIGDVCEIADGTQVDDNGNGIPDDCEGDVPTTLWINEFHYDNSGADVDEFVEVVLLDGVDPSQVTVSLYNGNGGGVYGTSNVANDFTAGESGSGFTVYSRIYPSNGIQNGPDAICIDLGGQVAMFISYEGVVVATDGPAVGLSSLDIGVSEGSTTPGSSLGLTGSGGAAGDFIWAVIVDLANPGLSNEGQTITAP
mgnify:CR=1 FL=1|tara:strand:+ start:33888 stop:37097 length:3210 start_codon:yes stop_codon:yes gene_type:complete